MTVPVNETKSKKSKSGPDKLNQTTPALTAIERQQTLDLVSRVASEWNIHFDMSGEKIAEFVIDLTEERIKSYLKEQFASEGGSLYHVSLFDASGKIRVGLITSSIERDADTIAALRDDLTSTGVSDMTPSFALQILILVCDMSPRMVRTMKKMDDEKRTKKEKMQKNEFTPIRRASTDPSGRFLEEGTTPTLFDNEFVDNPSHDSDSYDAVATIGGNNDDDDKAEWNGGPALDVYTLMFLANIRSASFLFSGMIFFLQASILSLTLVDLLRNSDPYNLMKIPINNPPEVVVAQFLSLLVLVLLQEHTTFVTLVNVIKPLSTNRFVDYPNANWRKWVLGNACRLIVHLLSMLVSFVFIVQIDEVIDMFSDFAAIQFVTHLSQVAFFCALYGFFGKEVKQDASYANAWNSVAHLDSVKGLHALGKAQLAGDKFDVALVTYQNAMNIAEEDERRACKRKLEEAQEQVALSRVKNRSREGLSGGFASLVLAAMLAGWAYLLAKQESNELLVSSACKRIDIQLGFAVYDLSDLEPSPFPLDLGKRTDIPIILDLASPSPLYYSYFNGVYTVDVKHVHNDRLVYFENSNTANKATSGKFSYCKEEKVWIFEIGEFNDMVPRGACGQWLLRSEPTEEFFLENVSSEWTAWTGYVQPMSIGMKCMDCSKAAGNSGCNFNGECDSNGMCTCKDFPKSKPIESYFGELCSAPPPCRPVDVFVHGETADDYRQVAHFMPLEETPGGKRVLTYQRPVYWNKRNSTIGKQNFLLYTGSRWFHTDWPLMDLCPESSNTVACGKAEFASFFTDNFHAYWFDTLADSTLYISEETSSFTPVGLKWLTLGQTRAHGDFGLYGFTLDESVSAHCFNLNNDCGKTDLCGKSSECANDSRYNLNKRSRCECKNGTSGYFCQFEPDDPYVATQIGMLDSCSEFFCDYLYDQALNFSGSNGISCSTRCEEIRELKACWNTGAECSGVVMRQIEKLD